MIECARGGKAQRPGVDRFASEPAHLCNFLLCSVFAISATISHYVNTKGGMGYLGCEINIMGS